MDTALYSVMSAVMRLAMGVADVSQQSCGVYVMHKHYGDNIILNMVNYMSDQFRDGVFKGFVKLEDGYYFGTVLGDDEVVAIHYLGLQLKVKSDEQERELRQIQGGYNYLCVIYGSDNQSYMKRFISEEEFNKWFEDIDTLTIDQDMLFYNS